MRRLPRVQRRATPGHPSGPRRRLRPDHEGREPISEDIDRTAARERMLKAIRDTVRPTVRETAARALPTAGSLPKKADC